MPSAQAICASATAPTQVRFMLADYRSGLLDAVPESHLLAAGAVNRNNATLEEAIKALAINLQKRLPPPDLTTAQLRARSWWTGPDVVLLVDDWHMIVAASGVMPPMAPLVAAVTRGGGHRAAHHRDVPDEPGPSGHHGQVRRRRIRGRVADHVPFRGEAGVPVQRDQGQAAASWPGVFRLAGWQGGHPGGLRGSTGRRSVGSTPRRRLRYDASAQQS